MTTIIPPGRIMPEESDYITSVVKTTKPQIVLESGTGSGGGSTLSIVRGLLENKSGVLHTFEPYRSFYDGARQYYEASEFASFIKLYNRDFNEFVNNLDNQSIEGWGAAEIVWSSIDLMFLDGGDEAENGQWKLSPEYLNSHPEESENFKAFKTIEQRCKIGMNLMCHDWITGRGSFIRKYLENKNYVGWKMVKFINSVEESGHQIGMCHLVRMGK
jgi:hypothetical protein